MVKKFTIKQVYEAIAKNGLRWEKETFWSEARDKDGKPLYACAIGQAAWNLEVDPHALHSAMTIPVDRRDWVYLAGGIEDFNDNKADSYEEVVAFAKEYLAPYFDTEIEIWEGEND